ncbi:hypothetical protein N9878_00360 [bacterium]|nr:hypothetical protein [bacterium]
MNELIADSLFHPSGGMNKDSNGLAMAENEAVDIVNCVVTQHDVGARTGSRLLGEGLLQPISAVLSMHKYEDPERGSRAFAFCSESIHLFVLGAGWVELTGYDGIGGGLLEGKSLSYWSVTSVIDDTAGASVVAAGSIYVDHTDAQSGGSSRVLLWYDRTSGTFGEFKTLDIVNLLPIVEEGTGVVPTSVPGSYPLTEVGPQLGVRDAANPNYDSDFTGVEPKTTVLRTIQHGVIAVVGNKLYEDAVKGDYYRWVPTDTSVMEYSDLSYFRADGSEWEIRLLTEEYGGEEVLIDYEYQASFQTYPAYVSFFKNSLIMASTFEDGRYYPWRIRHTTQTDLYKTRASYYQDVAVNDITAILGMKNMETVSSSLVEDYLYIYKPNSVVRATYNKAFNADPDLIAPFLSFDTAVSEGLESPRTVVNMNGMQMYMGRNDIFLFNGTQRVSATFNDKNGASRIREQIFQDLDLRYSERNFAVYDEINKRYMLYVKLLSSESVYPTNCFVYDVERGIWSRYIVPPTASALNAAIRPVGAINDLKLPINSVEYDIPIDDLSGNVTKVVLYAMTDKVYIGDSSGQDKIEDGVGIPYDSYFITRDFVAQTLEHDDRTSKVYIEGRRGSVDIAYNGWYSTNLADFKHTANITFGGAFSRKSYNPDCVSSRIRFLVTINSGFRFRWLQSFSMRQEMTNI